MTTFGSRRAVRWVIVVAVAAFLATTSVVSVAIRDSGDPWAQRAAVPTSPAPEKMSLNAVLTAVASAQKLYLKVPGIPGESLSDRHKDEIELKSVAFGVTNASGSATGGVFDNLTVAKFIDASSPLLMKATAAGTALGTVVLTGEKAGTTPQLYVVLTLTGAKARSYKALGDLPNGFSDSVGFSFTSLKLTYYKQTSTGTLTPIAGCWNLTTHAAC